MGSKMGLAKKKSGAERIKAQMKNKGYKDVRIRKAPKWLPKANYVVTGTKKQ